MRYVSMLLNEIISENVFFFGSHQIFILYYMNSASFESFCILFSCIQPGFCFFGQKFLSIHFEAAELWYDIDKNVWMNLLEINHPLMC